MVLPRAMAQGTRSRGKHGDPKAAEVFYKSLICAKVPGMFHAR